MNRLWMLAVVAVIPVACQPQSDSSESAADASGPATTASVDCPAPGPGGRVNIAPGLDATILKNGYGRAAMMGDNVVVNAKLWVYDETAEGGKGEFVWESGAGGFPFRLGDDRFIAGWSPGIECMLLGERRELIIASELAYGADGRAPIPPDAAIIYDLELTRILEQGE